MRLIWMALLLFAGMAPLSFGATSVEKKSKLIRRTPAADLGWESPSSEEEQFKEQVRSAGQRRLAVLKWKSSVPEELANKMQRYEEFILGSNSKLGFKKKIQLAVLSWEKEFRSQQSTWGRMTKLFATPVAQQRPYTWNEPALQSLFREGAQLRDAVQEILDSSSFSSEQKVGSAYLYVRSVLLPTRELSAQSFDPDVSMPSAADFPKDPTQKMLINLPVGAFPEGSPELALILVGPPDWRTGCQVGEEKMPMPQHGLKANKSSDGRHYELDFDPIPTISRDIFGLSCSLTAYNFMRAMRLQALQMLLSQLEFYNSLVQEKTPLEIPRTCRRRIHGDLPDELPFAVHLPQTQMQKIDELLARQGLLNASTESMSDLDGVKKDFYEYYIQSRSFDPKSRQGFPSFLPFQKVRAGLKALNPQTPLDLQPGIDAVEDFAMIYSGRMSRALESIPYEAGRKKFSHSFTLSADPMGPYKNLTLLMVERMKARNTQKWWEIIPPELMKFLVANPVEIELAPLSGPEFWRRKTFGWLADAMNEGLADLPNSRKVEFLKVFSTTMCPNRYFIFNSCEEGTEAEFNKVKQLLASYRGLAETDLRPLPFIPANSEMEKIYPQLKKFYQKLVAEGFLKSARRNEWWLLKTEMGRSPWAALRLSFLLNYGFGRHDLQLLGVTHTANPYLWDRLLSPEEKKNYWTQIVKVHDQTNQYLLRTETPGERESRYETLARLDSEVVLNTQQGRELLARMRQSDKLRDSKKIEKAFTEISNDPRVEQAQKILEVYNARGNLDKQLELYDDYLHKYPEVDSRELFIELNNAYKKPLFRQVVMDGARVARKNVRKELESLCEADPKDLVGFKKTYRAALFAQDKINQSLGLRDLPESVKDEIDRWTKEDFWDASLLTGQVVACAGGMVGVGACTWASGGLCATLTPAALAMCSVFSTAKVGDFVYDKVQSNERERYYKIFKEMGHISQAQFDESVNKPSYIAAIMDALGVVLAPELSIKGLGSLTRLLRGSKNPMLESALYADKEVLGLNAKALRRGLIEAEKSADVGLISEIWSKSTRVMSQSAERLRMMLVEATKVPDSTIAVEEAFAQTVATYVKKDELVGQLLRLRKLATYRAQAKEGRGLAQILEDFQKVPDEAGYRALLLKYGDEIQELSERMPFSPGASAFKLFSIDNSLPQFLWGFPRPTEMVLKRLASARKNLLFETRRMQAARAAQVPEAEISHISRSGNLRLVLGNLDEEIRSSPHPVLVEQQHEVLMALSEGLAQRFPLLYPDVTATKTLLASALAKRGKELASMSAHLDSISLAPALRSFDRERSRQLGKIFCDSKGDATHFQTRCLPYLRLMLERRQN